MEYIIDIQGFKKMYNEFVVKELAIVSLEDDIQPSVFLFAPPHDWNLLNSRYKCENKWLTENYHGMNWQDGKILYDELEDILKSTVRGASQVWIKGLEKRNFLKIFLPNVKNIETVGCPALNKLHKTLDSRCSNHNFQKCFNSNCAARNAIVLKKWLRDYREAPTFSMYQEINFDHEDVDY